MSAELVQRGARETSPERRRRGSVSRRIELRRRMRDYVRGLQHLLTDAK
ncbi:hypothetical protein [Streptomyces sp. MST-110588]|nr:hypothetical protein [Streptomyces sp. MST-110588]UNO40670.1 hypothetical protein KGS77_15190 [Streptomyces sp. MST-110588]